MYEKNCVAIGCVDVCIYSCAGNVKMTQQTSCGYDYLCL